MDSTIVNFLFTVLGAVIGAGVSLFSPVVSDIYDKRKRKREVKYKLLKFLHLQNNYDKLSISANAQYKYNKKIVFFESHNLSISGLKEKAETKIAEAKENMANYKNETQDLFHKFSEIEGEIFTSLFESKDAFGDSVYDELSIILAPIVNPQVEELPSELDFEKMDYNAFVNSKFPEPLLNHWQSINKKYNIITSKVVELLKE